MNKQLLKVLSLIMAVSILCSCSAQDNVSSSAPETSSMSEGSSVEITDSEKTNKIETSATTTESTETSAPETEETSKTEITTTTKVPETEATLDKKVLLDVIAEGQGTLFESGSGIMAASMILKYYGVDVNIDELYNCLDMVDVNREDVTPWEYCMGTPKTMTALYYAPVVKNMINTYLANNGIIDLVATDISGCEVEDIYNYILNEKPIIIVANADMMPEAENGVSWILPNGETFIWKVGTSYWTVIGVSDNEVTVVRAKTGRVFTLPKYDFEKSFIAYESQAIIIE